MSEFAHNVAMAVPVFEEGGKVFRYWFCIGASGKILSLDNTGDKTLVDCNPGIELLALGGVVGDGL
jgi:hypothetical protein